jgi:hypothetical protein
MSSSAREAVWVLLSDLFIDSTKTDVNLRAMGKALAKTGYSAGEVEQILLHEVAPVCGKWMSHPGAVGPWPMFDELDLRHRIRQRIKRPWYRRWPIVFGLWSLPGVRRQWKVVQHAMQTPNE